MRTLFSLALLLSAFASGQTPPAKTPLPTFEDVAKQVGLTVSHISSPEKRYIVESMSGGAGLIDCDNDGRLDIITVNGSTVDRYKQGGDPMITLYHQDDGFANSPTSPSPPDSPAKAGAWAWLLPITTTTVCPTST